MSSLILRTFVLAGVVAALVPIAARAEPDQPGVNCWTDEDPRGKDFFPKCKTVPAKKTTQKSGPARVSVSFSSNPPGAVVRLDNAEICSRTPCEELVAPGRHLVEMDLGPGYDVASQTFNFSSSNRDAYLAPTPRFARISVQTEPSGLAVSLDGVRIGLSPVSGRDVTLGSHNVAIDDPCWDPATAAVYAVAGATVPVTLKGRSRVVQVDTSASDPTGASVSGTLKVDGVTVGSVPGSVIAPACGKVWVVTAADGRRWEGMPVVSGSRGTLKATLPAPPKPVNSSITDRKPPPATTAFLTVESNPSGLPVKLNGLYLGKTPIFDALVPPGTHVVAVDDPCAERANTAVTLAAGDRRTVSLDAPLKTAQIDVRPEDADKDPVDAEVLVDGAYVGTAPGVLTVPLCAKHIEVQALEQSSLKWSGALYAQAGQTTKVTARLIDPYNPRPAKTKWRTTFAWRLGMSRQTGVAGTGFELRWGPIGIAAGFGMYGSVALTFGGPSNTGGFYGELHATAGNPLKWYFGHTDSLNRTGYGLTGGYDFRPANWLSLRLGAGVGYNGTALGHSLEVLPDVSMGLVF